MPFYSHAKSLFAILPELEAELITYQNQSSSLYALEARHTLFHFRRLFQNFKHQPGLHHTFERYLKKRWDVIKQTDVQYCQDFNNPANRFCIEVAKALGEFYHKSYLVFLMPSLTSVPSAHYITSSYEEDLSLHYLLVSDDSTRLIHILDVLTFAQEDGVLKHNSLFDGRSKELSFCEQHRLLARHPSIEQHYLALQDKLNFVLHGETAGAYVNRLIKGLREGGKNQNGQEMIAHDESNIAIATFDTFLQSLSPSKREMLLKTNKFDRWISSNIPYAKSIEQCWQRLARPMDSNGDDSTYCVELIANDLEEILEENPTKLYQLIPFEGASLADLRHLDARLKDCEMTMLSDLFHATSYCYYGQTADEALALKLCHTLSRDSGFHLFVDEIIYIATLYNTHHCLEAEKSQNLSAQCKAILIQEGSTHSSTRIHMIKQALKRMTPDVVAIVKDFLKPNPRDEGQGYTFFYKSDYKRKRVDFHTEGRHVQTPGNP